MSKVMFVHHIVARSPNQCDRGNAILRSIFIVVGVDIPLNGIKVFFVAMEWQHCVLFEILSSYKILHTALDNNTF
jgi:hypothetical protein